MLGKQLMLNYAEVLGYNWLRELEKWELGMVVWEIMCLIILAKNMLGGG